MATGATVEKMKSRGSSKQRDAQVFPNARKPELAGSAFINVPLSVRGEDSERVCVCVPRFPPVIQPLLPLLYLSDSKGSPQRKSDGQKQTEIRIQKYRCASLKL